MLTKYSIPKSIYLPYVVDLSNFIFPHVIITNEYTKVNIAQGNTTVIYSVALPVFWEQTDILPSAMFTDYIFPFNVTGQV